MHNFQNGNLFVSFREIVENFANGHVSTLSYIKPYKHIHISQSGWGSILKMMKREDLQKTDFDILGENKTTGN